MEFMEELHGYELEALKAFVQLCDKHGLTYFVIGGTLLGALRHRGFIPWDDDVDVAMPRKDYDKFLTLAKELPDPLVLEDYHFTKGFLSYFAKIRNDDIEICEALTDNEADKRIGYLIDILPIDGTPNVPLLRKLYYAKVLGLRFLCGAANVHTGIRTSRPKWEQQVLKLCRALKLYRVLHIERIYAWMDRLFHRQNVERSVYSGTITGAYKTHEIVPTTYFGIGEEPVYLPFETIQVRAPRHYKKYLRHMFGNYEELPPESARKIHYVGKIVKKNGEEV
ncbi:MAG: phosphorylcholine transferase LicD [Lachnospiraceae bacterium]